MRRRGWVTGLVALALIGALAGGLSVAGGAQSNAREQATTTLKLGYVTTPQHPYGIVLNAFAKDVAARSKGSLKIDTLPNYPGGDAGLLNDVRGNVVPMASVSASQWDTFGVKAFQALQAPFLLTNYPLEGQVIGGSIGKKMLASPGGPAKLGLVGLAIHEGGLRKPLGAKSPLAKPADFKGKKLRAPPSNVLAVGMRSLGADPTPLAVGEVYQALQSGTVDGMEANLGLIQTNKYYEVAKYLTSNVNLWPFPTVLVINKSAWDKLSAEQQGILKAAAAKLPAESINVFLKPAKGAPDFTKLLCGEGMTFVTASKSDLASLTKAAQSAYKSLEKDKEVAGYIKQIQALKAKAGTPKPPPPLPAGCKTMQR
jgi:TRAP-type transport system periplasmic protein